MEAFRASCRRSKRLSPELRFATFRYVSLKQVLFVSSLVTQESFCMLYTSSLECTCAVPFAELSKTNRNNKVSFTGATVLWRQDLSRANAVNVLPVDLMGAVNGKAGMEPEGPPPKSKIVVSRARTCGYVYAGVPPLLRHTARYQVTECVSRLRTGLYASSGMSRNQNGLPDVLPLEIHCFLSYAQPPLSMYAVVTSTAYLRLRHLWLEACKLLSLTQPSAMQHSQQF